MSFYTSLNGLKNAQFDLDVISHNIANSETNGFKKGRAEFGDLVTGSGFNKQGIGATVEALKQNFNLGPIEQTGSALDFTINGDGFFTTRSPLTNQLLFTRNGGFTMGIDGSVYDSGGQRLQVLPTDADGTVTGFDPEDAIVPLTGTTGYEFTNLRATPNGVMIASFGDGSDQVIGTIALARFSSVHGLVQNGSVDWEPSGLSGAPRYNAPGTTGLGSILSGALERSNVDIAEELVALIVAQRNFQANAKAIDTSTQLSQTIINLRN